MDKKTLCFHYGDEKICFQRLPRKEESKKVLIKVHPDCSITVSAPSKAEDTDVLSSVKKRGRWIYRQLEYFRKQREHLTPRQYISGESHYYLGKQHMLKVIESPNGPQTVKLLKGRLEVICREKTLPVIQKLLNDWYKMRSKEVFARCLDELLDKTLWVERRPSLRVQNMKTQWGSCSPNGTITLNPNLVKAPKEFINYVILHELCHIAEHNHSERFYRLMQQVMPNWERQKEHLDQMAGIILTE